MITDKYGRAIVSEQDLCEAYLENPNRVIRECLVDRPIEFDPIIEIDRLPELLTVDPNQLLETIEQYDSRSQENWRMPAEYRELDIAEWLLNQCRTDEERQRVGQELLMYLDRNLFPLLQYLKYLVDTMRQREVVWGVGRGSSVASYVLFLIGIHRIDSLYYDLDINEFLR
jgi:DNA polymerase III alpha subunit